MAFQQDAFQDNTWGFQIEAAVSGAPPVCDPLAILTGSEANALALVGAGAVVQLSQEGIAETICS